MELGYYKDMQSLRLEERLEYLSGDIEAVANLLDVARLNMDHLARVDDDKLRVLTFALCCIGNQLEKEARKIEQAEKGAAV